MTFNILTHFYNVSLSNQNTACGHWETQQNYIVYSEISAHMRECFASKYTKNCLKTNVSNVIRFTFSHLKSSQVEQLFFILILYSKMSSEISKTNRDSLSVNSNPALRPRFFLLDYGFCPPILKGGREKNKKIKSCLIPHTQ